MISWHLPMMYMTKETTKPAKIMSSQTDMEKGARKAKRFTDLAGAFTYRRLIPVMAKS